MNFELRNTVQNLAEIRKHIPQYVTLVCVSKFHPAEAIMEAYDCGERDFGESRVQELLPKYEALPKDIRWHFIGHLQTNKVKMIVPFVHLIHSVDSVRLLETINREAEKIQRKVELLKTEKITVTLNTADIDVKVPSECTYSFTNKTFEITCIVASGYSKRVTADMFRLTLDATTLTPGAPSAATVRVALATDTNFTLFPVGLNTAQILVSTVE